MAKSMLGGYGRFVGLVKENSVPKSSAEDVSNSSPETPSEDQNTGPQYDTSSGNPTDYNDYNLAEYLEGLFSSVGAENEVNRNFNAEQAQINRDFNAEQAQIERDWQTQMSNSAYSRAVADLSKAGLNPILAVTGMSGATSYQGATASGSSASYNVSGGDTFSDVISALSSVAKSVAEFLPSVSYILKGKL